MDAGDDDRRWLDEIGRRFATRMHGVYLCLGAAALFGLGLANTQRMLHEPGMLPAQATIVALGTGSSGEPTFTATFADAEGNWHRDTQEYSYHYARGEPRVGEQLDYLYIVKPETDYFQAAPRADGILQWLFGVPVAFFVLLGIVLGVVIMREHNARRALVRSGQRVPVQMPRLGFRSLVLPAKYTSGSTHVELWRLEGRVYDASAGEYVDCASDWQQPPPPELELSRVPPLLVDPARPSRRWLPVGALRTAGYVAPAKAA